MEARCYVHPWRSPSSPAKPCTSKTSAAHRSKPGLKAQHLKAVDAAAAVSKAWVEGAILGSSDLVFKPTNIRSGRYRLDIGTAGATSLVLQTIFLPLSLGSSASSVIISGGTHVAWSPCFHYITLHWLPFMQEIGFNARVLLDQAGFYPSGGGRISATIRPAQKISPLHLPQRGKLIRVTGFSGVANLKTSIADRQKRQAMLRLQGLTQEENNPRSGLKQSKCHLPSKGLFCC